MSRIAMTLAAVMLLAGPARAGPEAGDMTTVQKCQSLVNLNEEWKRASLTVAQKLIRAQLVAWYRANCRRRGARK